MPRETSNTQPHKVRIFDGISGDTITFNYRLPTTQERVGYRKSMMQIKNGKLKDNSAETQLEYAGKVITGFEESAPDAAGKLAGGFTDNGKPYASDPASSCYASDWFELVKATSADLLMQAVSVIFGGTAVESGQAGDDDEAGPLA